MSDDLRMKASHEIELLVKVEVKEAFWSLGMIRGLGVCEAIQSALEAPKSMGMPFT